MRKQWIPGHSFRILQRGLGTRLHCEVLQLPHSIGCRYGWCGMPGIGVCVCVCVRVHEVGKMAKDIEMTICKGIVVSFLPCLVAFWGFHPYMFFQCFFVSYLFLLFLRAEEKGMNGV